MSDLYRQQLNDALLGKNNRKFKELIWGEVVHLLSSMKPYTEFELSQLCEWFWSDINHYEQCLAGTFVAKLVSRQMLPLKIIRRRGNTIVYQVIAQGR